MKTRRAALFLLTGFVIAGCASTQSGEQSEIMDENIAEAFKYLEAVRPSEVSYMRFREPLRYEYLNDMFVIVNESDASFLIQFRRACRELASSTIMSDMADVRTRRGMLRSGIDTIRGCRIEAIYDVTEEEAPKQTKTEHEKETDTGKDDEY